MMKLLNVRSIRSVILLLFILVSFRTAAQEEDVVLKAGEGQIKGTLTLPATKEKVPVVLLIAGSGPTDRDGNSQGTSNDSYKKLAEALNKEGIAVLRYDKRGIAASRNETFKERDMRFEDFVADAEGWVNMLAEDKRFSKVIIAGHSEGSLIGILAAEHNKAVKGFISIAGSGRRLSDVLREQLAAQPQQIKDVAYACLDTLQRGDTLKAPPVYLYALFRPSVQPYIISLFRYDPVKEIAKLKQDILVIQGTTDLQVKEKDADLLAAAAKHDRKMIISNMNHTLKYVKSAVQKDQMPSYTDPSLPLHQELVPGIVSFIRSLKN